MILKKTNHPLSGFASGFSLLEIAVVLIIIAFIGAATLNISTGAIQTKRRTATFDRAEAIQTAIALYVSQNKRLPCPADGTAAQGTAAAGREVARDANQDCAAQTTGTVPYIALGLSEDVVTDGWNSRFTYRVASGAGQELSRDRGMDMSDCDPSGIGSVATESVPARTKACSSSCASVKACTPITPVPPATSTESCTTTLSASCTSPTKFLLNKGFTIQDGAAPPAILADPASFTGAGYVLISHGENLIGAYSSQGVLLTGAVAAGTNETTNSNNRALQAIYIDAQYNASETTAHFDDIIFRPTIAQIIDRAKLGARSH